MNIDTNISVLSQKVRELSAAESLQGSEAIGKEKAAEFSQLLTETIDGLTKNNTASAENSEMQNLIAALDKSILGKAGNTFNVTEFAEAMLQDKNAAQDVLSQLAGGHMQAIVTTSSEDNDEDDTSIFGTNDYTKVPTLSDETESLSDNLETIMEHLNRVIVE